MTLSKQLVLLGMCLVAIRATAAEDPAARCAADKIKAVAKKTSAKLKCHAASKSPSVESKCLAKAAEKFSTTWTRIEARGGCTVTGDEQAVESKVDDYVTDVVTSVSRACGDLGGVCGGGCPTGLRCFAIGVGCYGEPEPCRCHGSTTTCPPTTSTTTSTVTTTSSCPTYTTSTLGLPDCGGSGGSCFGGCANARECVPDASDVCGCTGALLPCGVHSFAGTCGGECPASETCTYYSVILPGGCPDAPRCGCVPSP
jgi:hypothetical protein